MYLITAQGHTKAVAISVWNNLFSEYCKINSMAPMYVISFGFYAANTNIDHFRN